MHSQSYNLKNICCFSEFMWYLKYLAEALACTEKVKVADANQPDPPTTTVLGLYEVINKQKNNTIYIT